MSDIGPIDEEERMIIPPRDGIEVYVNRIGGVSIVQQSPGEDDAVILVQADDVDTLCGFLQAAKADALKGDGE